MVEIHVPQGSSVTTPDGTCTVHVLPAFSPALCEEQVVALRVTVGKDLSNTFETVKPGDRVSVTWCARTYYVDLHRIRANLAELALGWTVMQPSAELPSAA
jgi:hypothetical protein